MNTINSALRIEIYYRRRFQDGRTRFQFRLIGNSGTVVAFGPWRTTCGQARRDAARIRRSIAAPPHWSQVSSGDAGPAGGDRPT